MDRTSSHRLVLGVADALKVAIQASRLSRDTYPATMPDQLVRKLNPF